LVVKKIDLPVPLKLKEVRTDKPFAETIKTTPVPKEVIATSLLPSGDTAVPLHSLHFIRNKALQRAVFYS
jgi:hypothetical protein